MLAKKIALAFAIAMIFPTMVDYGVRTVSPKPRWDYTSSSKNDPNSPEWKAQEKRFEQTLFAVAVPIGLAAIITGVFLPAQALGSGLMFGGVFTLGDGYYNYWDDLPDSWKFISLFVIFMVLVFIVHRKIEQKKPDKAVQTVAAAPGS